MMNIMWNDIKCILLLLLSVHGLDDNSLSKLFICMFNEPISFLFLLIELIIHIFCFCIFFHLQYLSFPSLSNSGGQKFSFTIAETEGLQGSFECIQQNHNQLEVLGALPQKMRIHANEDVYETTRYRMAVAEENQKNKWYVKSFICSFI